MPFGVMPAEAWAWVLHFHVSQSLARELTLGEISLGWGSFHAVKDIHGSAANIAREGTHQENSRELGRVDAPDLEMDSA